MGCPLHASFAPLRYPDVAAKPAELPPLPATPTRAPNAVARREAGEHGSRVVEHAASSNNAKTAASFIYSSVECQRKAFRGSSPEKSNLVRPRILSNSIRNAILISPVVEASALINASCAGHRKRTFHVGAVLIGVHRKALLDGISRRHEPIWIE
jgi:hypothetical protein